MTFFFFYFGLHLILRSKLDVEVKTFFGLHRYFQWKRKQEIVPPPPFQISGHAPALVDREYHRVSSEFWDLDLVQAGGKKVTELRL